MSEYNADIRQDEYGAESIHGDDNDDLFDDLDNEIDSEVYAKYIFLFKFSKFLINNRKIVVLLLLVFVLNGKK